MANKNFQTMTDDMLKTVNGGVSTPLGDYEAEEIIRLYTENPDEGKKYLKLVLMFYPTLIDDFKAECEEKGLTIPEGMLEL